MPCAIAEDDRLGAWNEGEVTRVSREVIVLLVLVVLVALACFILVPRSPTPPGNDAPTPSTAPASPSAQIPLTTSSMGPDRQVLPGWGKWKDHRNPLAVNASTLAAGKTAFTRNCATCHGSDARGDGPAALALDPKPADLNTGQFKYGDQDWQVFRTIWEGVPRSGMAKWDGRISQE